MNYSIALPEEIHETACAHLIREDGQEDICFALWYPSQGRRRKSALIHKLLLPNPGERGVHGNASFNPVYFERAIQEALLAKAGIALLHSHPGPGWQGMSQDDVSAEKGHAAAALAATSLPLVGLTIGTDEAWSARFWEKIGPKRYQRRWCDSVRVVGERLSVTFADHLSPPPGFRKELLRTESAWGQKVQQDLSRLHVGIVGLGSVGSIIAETVARMGVSKVSLIDFDSVKQHNLDRILHSSRDDAANGRAKVHVLAKALKNSATAAGFTVIPLEFSVIEDEGHSAALDCDVIFSCVDRPYPRAALNHMAYAHLIPVIDGGIAARSNKTNTGIKSADWRAHTVGPGHKCLECLGQFTPEMATLDRDGFLDDPKYIEGLPPSHDAHHNENVFAFSLSVAALEIQHFLKLVVPDYGPARLGARHYHHVTGIMDADIKPCSADCYYSGLVAKGDFSGITFVAKHDVAKQARRERNRSMFRKLLGWINSQRRRV